MNIYRPASFSVDDPETLFDAIERHSFATIISTLDNQTQVTHAPLLLDRERGERGVLIGHFARANPHWRDADGESMLAVFHGPHAYISPRWYEHNDVVPTWNYVVVHAHCQLQLLNDRQRKSSIVRRFVEHYEGTADQPWSLDSADSMLIDGLLDLIVAFEAPIENLSGKWKLSQNHTPERRQGVVEGLQQQGDENSLAIAELMRSGSKKKFEEKRRSD